MASPSTSPSPGLPGVKMKETHLMRVTGHLTIQEGREEGGEDVPARETCADPDLMFNNMKNDRKDDEDL